MKRILQKDAWYYKNYVVLNSKNVIKYILAKTRTISMSLVNSTLETEIEKKVKKN